jgi:hypothetical protein
MIGLVIALVIVASMPALIAKPSLPENCDESSDDKECKDFQIISNKSHSALDNFTKQVLPEIIKKIREKEMGLSSV